MGQSAQPDDQEQLWLQMVNRFRADPAAELDRLANYVQPGSGRQFAQPSSLDPDIANALDFFQVDANVLRSQFNALQPMPPLAWSTRLHDSAEYYANLMIQRDRQAHDLDGLDILERVETHGNYDFTAGGVAAENLFAFAESVVYGHAAFVIDWGGDGSTGIQDPPGHRLNLLSPDIREVGIAVVPDSSPTTSVGPLVTVQHLAVDYRDGPFVVGAVYADQDANRFYSLGEGLSGITVELVDQAGRLRATTTTYGSGGYTLDLTGLSSGLFDVLFISEAIDHTVHGVRIAGRNVALDIVDPDPAIDALTKAVISGAYTYVFDVTRDGHVDPADRTFWVHRLKNTYFGDANVDGQFSSADLIQVFQAAEYEDNRLANSRWRTGDWDGDLEFGSSDLVLAFQDGGYERGPRAAQQTVPEPCSVPAAALAWIIRVWTRRRQR